MSKQIRKVLALLLSCAMVVTSFTFIGTNNLKAADEEAADQQIEQIDETADAEAEQVEAEDLETTEETLDIAEEGDGTSDAEEATSEQAGDAEKAAEEAKAEEEKKEEPARPAQTLRETADDGAKIIVHAPEGALPEGAAVRVKVVNSKSVLDAIENQVGEVEGLAAYDITIHDADGKEIQPEKPVSVQIKNADIDGKAAGVYHVNDEMTVAEPVIADTTGDDAAFDAEHFSIYVVVQGKPARVTYQFMVEGQSDPYDEQIVKNGEKLTEPAAPAAAEGTYFTGWYTKSGAQFKAFNTELAIGTNETIVLTAGFRDAIYVYFMTGVESDEEDAAPIKVACTKTYTAESGPIDFNNIDLPMDPDERLVGWYEDEGLSKKVEAPFTPEEDTTLYPYIAKGNWLYFDSGEGSYVEPMFITDITIVPSAPKRKNYKFAGWYTDPSCADEYAFTFGGTIAGDTTLYAKWTASGDEVEYTVQHMQENSYNTGYSCIETETLTGVVGELTEATVIDVENDDRFDGFEPGKVEQVTIEEEGTVVNVYYDRKTYTLTFKGKNAKAPICGKPVHWHVFCCYHYWKLWCPGYKCYKNCYNKYSCYDKHGHLRCGFTTCHHHTNKCYPSTESDVYVIEAKYGAPIAQYFTNDFFTKKYAGLAWMASNGEYDYALQTLDVMPNKDVTFNLYNGGRRSSDTKKTMYYWGTAIPGVDYGNTKTTIAGKDKKKFVLLKTVDTYFNYMTYEEEFHDMLGFERDNATTGFTGSEMNFTKKNCKYEGNLYYTRNEYSITFRNGGSVDSTKTYLYDQDISGANYTPTKKPSYVDKNAVFDGWYTTDTFEDVNKFEFNGQKMPAKNIVLYAKWKQVESKVYVKSSDTADFAYNQTVAYAGTINLNKLPQTPTSTDENKEFVGWGRVNAEGKVVLFNNATKIYQDTYLVPMFATSGTSYHIAYTDGTNIVYGEHGYLIGAKAEVSDLAHVQVGTVKIEVPEGKVFAGWECGGKYFLPGDSIVVSDYAISNENKTVVLTAVFKKPNTKTQITYKAGDGAATEDGKTEIVEDGLQNNISVTLPTAESLGFKRAGYTFDGWECVNAEGKTVTVAAGEEVILDFGDDADNPDQNIFTAKWKKSDATYTITEYYENEKGEFVAEDPVEKSGKIGENVSASTSTTREGYKFDEGNKNNKTSDTLEEGKTVALKVYFARKKVQDYFTLNITAVSASKKYDGNPLYAGAATVVDKDGKAVTANITYSGDKKNWLSDPKTISATNVADSKNVYVEATVDGYFGTLSDKGSITITRKSVTVTADDKEMYFGKTEPELTATINGVIEKEKKDASKLIKFSLSREMVNDAREEPYAIKVDLAPGGGKNQGNYEVTAVNGKFKIKPGIIDPGPNPEDDPDPSSSAKVDFPRDTVYNGKDQTWLPAVTTNDAKSDPIDTKYFTVTYQRKNAEDQWVNTEDGTNAGAIKVIITGKGNYSGEAVRYYTIAQAPLKVTTGGASKNFDGKDLTSDEITVTGFVNNESAVYKTTGSQTAPGSSDNTYEILWTDAATKASESNYYIKSETLGKLIVNEGSIGPEKDPDAEAWAKAPSSEPYDGADYYGEPDVYVKGKQTQKLTLATDANSKTGDYWLEYPDKDYTNAGENKKVIVHGINNYAGSTVTLYYNINKLGYTVVTESDSKVFDGQPLTAGGTITGLLDTEKDSVELQLTNSQTAVGSCKNAYTINWGTINSANYYLSSETIGDLTVSEGKIGDDPEDEDVYAVAEAPSSEPYDGEDYFGEPDVYVKGKQTQKLTRATDANSETGDYWLEYPDDDYTNAGENKKVIVHGINNFKGSDVTLYYNINKLGYTVVTESDSKVFDGQPLTAGGTITGLLNTEKDSVELQLTNSQTAVGSCKNAYTINWGTINSANYYLSSETIGDLTVSEGKIGDDPEDKDAYAVAEAPKVMVYNSESRYGEPDVYVKGNKNKKLVRATGANSETGDYCLEYPDDEYINVAKNKTVIVHGINNFKGSDVTLHYDIDPMEVTITPEDKNKKFGVAQDPELTATMTTLAKNDIGKEAELITYTLSRATGEAVGPYTISVDGNDNEIQGNYKLIKKTATFTITKGDVGPWDDDTYKANAKVTPKVPYTGKPQQLKPTVCWESDEDKPVDEGLYTLQYDEKKNYTDIGTYTVTVVGTGGDIEGSEIVLTYEIIRTTGTVTAANASKRFGENDPTSFLANFEGVNNETASAAGISFDVTRPDAGTEAGEAAGPHAIVPSGAAEQGNYKLNYVNGVFTIIPESIDPKDKEPEDDKPKYEGVTVDAPGNPTYNGSEQLGEPVVWNKDHTQTLIRGKDYILIYEKGGDYTNAGENKKVTVQGIGNYAGSVEVEYTILQKAVTVTAHNKSIKINEAVPTLTAAVSGTIGNETVAYTLGIDGAVDVTKAGTYTIKVNATQSQGNYSVTGVNGTLTITDEGTEEKEEKKGIIVIAPQDPKYDGKEHQERPTVTDEEGNPLTEGTDYVLVYPDKDYTNAGTVSVIVKGINGYEGQITASYTIQKRNVELKSLSATKKYDGEPLTRHELTVGGDGFANGEGFIYKFTGTQTEVGESDNTFGYIINETYAGTNEANYNISLVFGTLKVLEADDETVIDNPGDGGNGGNGGGGAVIRAINNNGQIVLQEIADEETPLANFFEDCCVLHLILLFMALCLFIYYMYDSKKRKGRIYDLEEELAKHGVIYW